MVRAWYINQIEVAKDQRNPSIGDDVDLEKLKEIGVEIFKIDVENYENNEAYIKLRNDRGYSYSDKITISKHTLPDYDKKIKIFFQEHLHLDEEIRYIVDGSGYFDIRDRNDKWIRMEVGKNDLLVLPAGIYHRFTLDKQDYIVAVRLFQGEPVWTPYNRPSDDKQQRKAYLQKFDLMAH